MKMGSAVSYIQKEVTVTSLALTAAPPVGMCLIMACVVVCWEVNSKLMMYTAPTRAPPWLRFGIIRHLYGPMWVVATGLLGSSSSIVWNAVGTAPLPITVYSLQLCSFWIHIPCMYGCPTLGATLALFCAILVGFQYILFHEIKAIAAQLTIPYCILLLHDCFYCWHHRLYNNGKIKDKKRVHLGDNGDEWQGG
ncbi:hypothetical protein GE061_002829 [Apolygus lucorum]|uniref:Translocator protein n=1 Tax=Apolygus lucorum TaxID=248454 RepID=A0A6A4JAM7_APOLU|nr:hypothetical protein GE061_002829 [Apolygus lucorum]